MRADRPRPPAETLVRSRLTAALRTDPGLPTLVVAPGGWGKTTLLSQYADTAGVPVAWLRIETPQARPDRVLAQMRAGLDTAAGEDAVARGPASLLIVDDLHLTEGAEIELAVLDHAFALGRGGVQVLIASRRMPQLDPSRHELPGDHLVDAERLRFRAWEVERLLREVYREPLPADDVAVLSRRVGGWAAGLTLYHLSTHGRGLAERRRAVAALTGGATLAGGYLTRAVLADLPEELRRFLSRTGVFEAPTAARCDRLLGVGGSQRHLAELQRRQAFTVSYDGGRTFRYHEVLRAHLVATMTQELGAAAVRSWHARAAEILEAEGALVEAVRCQARAEDWPAVRRLLGRLGIEVAEHGLDAWAEVLPGWLIGDDPWLILAEGRHRVAQGQVGLAVERLARAETMLAPGTALSHCRLLRDAALAWLPDAPAWRGHWSGWLRAATRRHPAVVAGEAESLPPPERALVRVVALLLAGDLAGAARALRGLPDDDAVAGALRRLLVAAGALAAGRAAAVALDSVALRAERAGLPWLGRLARAVTAVDGTAAGAKEALVVAEECDRLGDHWGALLSRLIVELGRSRTGAVGVDQATALVTAARELDSGVLTAWAQSLLALAAVQDQRPDAELEVRRAESTARAAGVPGARTLALAAAVRADPQRPDVRAALDRAAAQSGLPSRLVAAWRSAPPGTGTADTGAGAAVMLRCFGGFRLSVDGRTLDWSPVRPQARALARLLAMHAGRPVHRDHLVDALWPQAERRNATQRLHVALSSLRRFLDANLPGAGPDSLLCRDGDAYLFALPEGGYCDVAVFREALERSRLAAGTETGLAALRLAVESYRGDLLPEDGPAEWVVNTREALRRQAAEAAATLAGAELTVDAVQSAAPVRAVAMAARCVEIDPCHDLGWRLLIAAHERAGDLAAAQQARRRYGEVLLSLGLDPAASGLPVPAPVTGGRRIPPPRSPGSASTAAHRPSGPPAVVVPRQRPRR